MQGFAGKGHEGTFGSDGNILSLNRVWVTQFYALVKTRGIYG